MSERRWQCCDAPIEDGMTHTCDGVPVEERMKRLNERLMRPQVIADPAYRAGYNAGTDERFEEARDPYPQVVDRPCTVCMLKGTKLPAAYVVRGVDGSEWFECEGHGPHDHGIERKRRTPIVEWFTRRELPVPMGPSKESESWQRGLKDGRFAARVWSGSE
jgi:hypothetical protein